jgi:hypothetical protein
VKGRREGGREGHVCARTSDKLIQHDVAARELVDQLSWGLGKGSVLVGVTAVLREGGREGGREKEG